MRSGIEAVLDAALSDPDLSAAIDEINLAYLEEAGIPAFANAAQTVADLAQKHLAGAAEQRVLPTSVRDMCGFLSLQCLQVHP